MCNIRTAILGCYQSRRREPVRPSALPGRLGAAKTRQLRVRLLELRRRGSEPGAAESTAHVDPEQLGGKQSVSAGRPSDQFDLHGLLRGHCQLRRRRFLLGGPTERHRFVQQDYLEDRRVLRKEASR